MCSSVRLPSGAGNHSAGICEHDIDASYFIADLVVEAIEIGRLGDVALDGLGTRSKKGGGGIEFCLPAARDVNARAFFHENLGRGQANSGVSTSDDSDLSIEFRHFFLKLVG
jgi:hypothetical protein